MLFPELLVAVRTELVHAVAETRSLVQKPAHKDLKPKMTKARPFRLEATYVPVSKRARERSFSENLLHLTAQCVSMNLSKTEATKDHPIESETMAESLARSDPNHFSRLPQGPVTQVTRQLSGQQPVLLANWVEPRSLIVPDVS